MKKALVLLILLICGSLYASTVIVSTDIGFDSINSTSFLQYALEESTADTIVIDNVGQPWRTGPLTIERNDITIILEAEVTIQALPNVFDVHDPLIGIYDKENITIMGYGAHLTMNRQEYVGLADSEYRHGIRMGSAKNIWIEGLTVLDTGGDGFIMNKSFLPGSTQNYCENITLLNCKASNNYRQGLSLVSVKNADILYCEFSETSGALPEDGIDIEPFEPDQRIEEVLIKGCSIVNNYGNAIQIAMAYMNDSSIDISITIEDTYMSNNHDSSNVYAYAEIAATDNKGNGVDGFVKIKNCYIENSQWSAIYVSKSVESYDLMVEQCVFKDISNDPIPFNAPIYFEVTNYDDPVARFGGVSFTDCTIIYDEDIPFLDLYENLGTSDGLGNVFGNFYVINPNPIATNFGTNPDSVNISFEHFTTAPNTTIELETAQTIVEESSGLGSYSAKRMSSDLIPLAANMSLDGQATYGRDYQRHPGFVLFLNGQDEVSDSLLIVQDTIIEGNESLDISLAENDCYTIGQQGALAVTITEDPVLSATDFPSFDLSFYPNPADKHVLIRSEEPWREGQIWALSGELLQRFSYEGSPTMLDLQQIPSGAYFLTIVSIEGRKEGMRRDDSL